MYFSSKEHVSTLLLLLISFHGYCEGEIESTITQCCNDGILRGTNKEPCSTYVKPIPNIPWQYQNVCGTTMEICCLQIHRLVMCSTGTDAGRLNHPCVKVPREGGEYYKDCCDGCKVGIAVRGTRDASNCKLKSFDFSSPWAQAFNDCCHNPNSSAPLNNTLGTNALGTQPVTQDNLQHSNTVPDGSYQNATTGNFDECKAFPAGQLCDHICIDTLHGYYCQCNSGYRLQSDAKTCVLGTDRCGLNNPCSQLCTDTGDAVICECNVGYELQNDRRTCIDIDECAIEEDECDLTTQYCVNSIGSYQCINQHDGSVAPYGAGIPDLRLQQVCTPGYEFSIGSNSCKDLDECALGLDACDRSDQFCSNTDGSYVCLTKESRTTCPPGYKHNQLSATCMDVNECAEGLDACNREREFCLNLQGTYECQLKSQSSCPAGYKFNSAQKTCEDINECQQGQYNCLTSQRCDNTIGSYTCIRLQGCGTGYTLNAHTSLCEDDDECVIGTHNCGQGWVCRNTLGSFRCDRKTCPYGYRLAADGSCNVVQCETGMRPDESGTCVDHNECDTVNVCRPHQRCINTVGSYECQNKVNCGSSYELDAQGTTCQDIDECAKGIHECRGGQECINHPGSYVCQCQVGYMLNAQRECEDINECTRYGKVCAYNAECENTPGSYVCKCNEGFKHGDNDKVCIDVDECKEFGSSICQQTCINTWGSYQCTCSTGYTQGKDKRTCTDVDECTLYKGRGNLCIGYCVNIPGSYSCSCPPGYKLGADKRICQDIDECAQGNVCSGSSEVCLNTRGSYKCNRIECPAGYIRDTTHKNRCKRESTICPLNDEACINQPLSYSHNYLTFVSNLTIPPTTGFVNLFTMRGPSYYDVSAEFKMDLKSTRAQQGIPQATRDYFQLRKQASNQAAISLIKSIPGPQDIELELIMKLYRHSTIGGVAVAKLFIYVSEYDF